MSEEKKVDLKFDPASLTLSVNVDTNNDGENVVALTVNLAEVWDEVSDAVEDRKKS